MSTFLDALAALRAVPTRPADPIGDLNAALAQIDEAEQAYRRLLVDLAARHASPEEIVAFAVADRIRRFVVVRSPFGGSTFGANEIDLAQAAVEALRLTGHLPAAEPVGVDWSRVHDGIYENAEEGG